MDSLQSKLYIKTDKILLNEYTNKIILYKNRVVNLYLLGVRSKPKVKVPLTFLNSPQKSLRLNFIDYIEKPLSPQNSESQSFHLGFYSYPTKSKIL